MEKYSKEDALKYLIRNINKYEKWCGFTMFNSLLKISISEEISFNKDYLDKILNESINYEISRK